MKRSEARSIGLKRFLSDTPCKFGHGNERYSLNGSCCECHRLRVIKNRAENPEQTKMLAVRHKKKYYSIHREAVLAAQKIYMAKNQEKVRAARRLKYQKNKTLAIAYNRKFQRENPELCALWRREYVLRHPDRKRARRRSYQAAKIGALPSWADFEEIKIIYLEAERLSRSTGIPHHVDHIYPLRGKNVCGLHVAANLQVLTAFENLSKGCSCPGDLV